MNDNSPIPFGKYEGQKLINVPADYLIWLYENNLKQGPLRNYVADNIDVLRAEVSRRKQRDEYSREVAAKRRNKRW